MTQGRIEVKKQCGTVSLNTCVLEACDPNTYANAHGWTEWENAMVKE